MRKTFEPGITATITLTSLGNGAGRISTKIDNTKTRADRGRLWFRTKMGAVAPTVGTPIKVYLVRHSDMATNLADNALGAVDAAVTAEPVQAECIGAIIVAAVADAVYEASFALDRLPPQFSIVIWNATGQALSTTATHHIIQIVLEGH